MMMEGYLDISGCAEKWRKAIGIDRIPVRVGIYEKDLDVIEHALAQEDLRSLRSWMEKKYENAGVTFRSDWPVGFDLKGVPPGAVLHLEG